MDPIKVAIQWVRQNFNRETLILSLLRKVVKGFGIRLHFNWTILGYDWAAHLVGR